MSELRLLNCVENGAGICRNELLFEAMQESFNGLKEKNRVLAEELDNLRASKGIDEIIARAEAAEVRVAELEAARERFEVTDDLLNQATVTIGAVIACCTYNSNEDAKIGIYGISPDAFTRIDQFIANYNRAVSAGKVSVDVKRDLSDAEIEELGAQEAEKRGEK